MSKVFRRDAMKSGSIYFALFVPGAAASVPLKPIFPNLSFTIPLAACLDLIMGLEVSLLAELLGRKVRSASDIDFDEAPLIATSQFRARTLNQSRINDFIRSFRKRKSFA